MCSINSFPYRGFYPYSDDVDIENSLLSRCNLVPDFPDIVTNPQAMCFYHLNCRSVRNKASELDLLVNACNRSPDVVMLTETWLSMNDVFVLPGYNVFNCTRNDKKGGGVSLCVKNHINFHTIVLTQPVSFEVIGGIFQNLSTVSLVIYRPPSSSVETFLDELDTLLTDLHNVYKDYKFIIGGDFNINYKKHCNLHNF